MRKPINITIDPQIDTDPAITYLIRVEGGKDQIFGLLDHAEQCGCESYEIVKYPDGVWIPDSRHAAKFPDNTRKNSCGCYGNPPCKGCAPKTDLPDNADLSSVPDDPDANRLHLFKVFTINEDTSETDGIFVMALCEAGAACLYHKARAREHDNILCEVVVSKVADAEVCDG